jgi:hypothetical protein
VDLKAVREQLRSVAAVKVLDLLGLQSDATCELVADGDEFTVYVLADDVMHELTGKVDLSASPAPDAQSRSTCSYRALPITHAARFNVTITKGGVNNRPGEHELTFHLGLSDDEPLVLRAKADEPGSGAFAGALVRTIANRAGRIPEVRTLTPSE